MTAPAMLTDEEIDNELQYKLLYAIVVSGKSAKFAEGAMRLLHKELHRQKCWKSSWKESLSAACDQGVLSECIRAARMGNYSKTEKAFRQFVAWDGDLATCTAEDLEQIHGVGLKTSRFFLRWTGRRDRFAVLDVHILRWLSEKGHVVPPATPASKREYQRIEKLFLAEADALWLHPADLDEQIWLQRNKSGIRQ